MTRRQSLFGVPLDPLTMDETVQRCLDAVRRGEQIEIGMVNAAKLVNMRRDPPRRGGRRLRPRPGRRPGRGLGGQVLGVKLPERVAGIDLFMRLLAAAEVADIPVYLLGAQEDVLEMMLGQISERFPKLRVAGSRNGYFGDGDQEGIADAIADSAARLLFLGMTSPKKEIFTAGYGKRTGAHVVHGVGGSFDILARHHQAGPLVWQRMGLEWFYRTLQEPRRLGKRYLTTNAAFLLMTVRELIHRTPSAPSANRSY